MKTKRKKNLQYFTNCVHRFARKYFLLLTYYEITSNVYKYLIFRFKKRKNLNTLQLTPRRMKFTRGTTT